MARFKAFISYKHVTSTRFAENLEIAIKAYGKPIYRPPMAVFRDEKYLNPGIDLPKRIRDALDRSEFLIFLASPEAATSNWVEDEIEHWCVKKQRQQRIIIVLTDGKITTDLKTKKIDWTQTDALPSGFAKVLEYVPLYVDLSWAKSDRQQTLLNPDYKKAINAIVATLRGVDPLELSGQEILQHRANVRIRNTLIAAIACLSLLVFAAAWFAWIQMLEAEARAREATSRRLAAESDRLAEGRIDTALLLMAQAYRMGDNTALRGSWWRLLGSPTLASAYLPVLASEAYFHADGALELHTEAGSTWFTLEGSQWIRSTTPSDATALREAAVPVWEWSGGCEDLDCERDDVWECAEVSSRSAGPYGETMDFCSASRIRVPDWCGGATMYFQGGSVSVRRVGRWLNIGSKEGKARYVCVEVPKERDNTASAAPRPQLIAGTRASFPNSHLKRLEPGGAAIRWLSRSLDGQWYAVIRESGYPEIRRYVKEDAAHRRPGVSVMSQIGRAEAIATSINGEIVVGTGPEEPRGRGDMLYWQDYGSACGGEAPDQVVSGAWRTHRSLGGVLTISRQGAWVASGATVDVTVRDMASGTEVHRAWFGREAALDAALSPDNAIMVVATRPLDGALDPPPKVFDLRGGRQGVPLGDTAALDIEFDPDRSDTVLLAGKWGIHALPIGKGAAPVTVADDPVELLAVDPSRRILGASLADHSLLVRGLDEPTETFRSVRRASPALGLAFDSTGSIIVRASQTSLEAWDWRANTWWNIDANPHEDVAMLPDEAVLALQDGHALIYDLKPASWLELTCNIVRRNLSYEEWLAHIGHGFDYECACPTYSAGDGWSSNDCGNAGK